MVAFAMTEPEQSGPAPWFRKKRHGYGWSPNTWQGWLVTFGIAVIFVVVVLAVVL